MTPLQPNAEQIAKTWENGLRQLAPAPARRLISPTANLAEHR